MKRFIFAALAMMIVAAPVANAQKVNKEALVAKLAKVDSDSNDAKKNTKGATWINRGNAYYEAASAPSKDIFPDMDYAVAQVALGRASAQTDNVVLNGAAYTEYTYPWVKVYVAGDGKIKTWIVTQNVKEGNLALEAANSFSKAAQVDPKSASKAHDGLAKVESYFSNSGSVNYSAGQAGQAAADYMSAFAVQEMQGYNGEKNYNYLFNAGLMYVVDGETNAASYAKGAEVLNKALEAGFADEEGQIYYYLFHAYYGQKDSSVRVANLQRAKQVLMEGLAKYPSNTLIIEGLISIYIDPQNPVGDPQELVDMVDGALQRDPQNKSLWNSRAIMFDRMKNYEESIKSFQKVVELDPQNVQATYNLGLSHIFKGDAMNDEMNTRDYKSNADFQADQKKVIEAYKPAVPILEAAHKLDPKHTGVLETLKSLTFRLRDEEGMMAKYEQYNKALNDLKAQ